MTNHSNTPYPKLNLGDTDNYTDNAASRPTPFIEFRKLPGKNDGLPDERCQSPY